MYLVLDCDVSNGKHMFDTLCALCFLFFFNYRSQLVCVATMYSPHLPVVGLVDPRSLYMSIATEGSGAAPTQHGRDFHKVA